MTAALYEEIDKMGGSRSQRWGARISNFLLHTQEGNGTPESLAAYLNNQANGVSYHYTVGGGRACAVVDTDFASWSVLDANSSTINLCFAGSRASWLKSDWLRIEEDLRIAAWLAVRDAEKYRFSTDVIGPDYSKRRDGISDHRYVTDCLGVGTHTDVGRGFPWREFAEHVREFVEGAPAAPAGPPAIDVVAAATPWLGKRLSGEIPTPPDGVGRRSEFENGHIYWHPLTGAYAIGMGIFAKYFELGCESGPLGYPITVSTNVNGGLVQGFQGGAVYFRDDHQPVWVRGAIRERWNRTGFENGPLGWAVSDEREIGDGGSVQEFDNGHIVWPSPKRDTAVILTADGPDVFVPDRD